MRPRKVRQNDSGQAMVEMALVLPIMLALLFGIIDIGYGTFKYVGIHQGTREALRMAQMNVPIMAGGSPIPRATYRAMIKGVLVNSAPGVGLTSAQIDITVAATAGTLGESYPQATIRVNHPHTFFGPFQLAGQQISIGCELRCEIETWRNNETPNFDGD